MGLVLGPTPKGKATGKQKAMLAKKKKLAAKSNKRLPR